MTIEPTLETLDNTAGLTAAELAAYRAVLAEIVTVGVNLIRILNHHATKTAETLANPAFGFAVAFERVARAVRRTILLDCKLAEAATNPLRFAAPARQAKAEPAEQPDRPDRPESDHPESEPRERLERVETEIDNRPIPEIIASIRNDLDSASNLVANTNDPASPRKLVKVTASPTHRLHPQTDPPPQKPQVRGSG